MIIELGNNTITKKILCDYIRTHSSFHDKYKQEWFFTKYDDTVIDVKDKYIILASSFDVGPESLYTHWCKDNKIPYKQLPGNMIFRIIDKLIENYKLAENQLKLEQLKEDFK